MRVIIMAASPEQGALVDKLIKDKDICKIILTPATQKIVKEAQAIIIYFESVLDLLQMKELKKIYNGIPLQIHFGPQPIKIEKDKNDIKYFFSFHQIDEMI